MNEDQKPNDPVNEAASSSDTEKSPAQQVETKTEIENNATTSTEQQQAPEIAKKKKYLLLALIPVLLAVIAFGLWKSYQPAPLELQGRVEAETVQVATKVPSRIEEIYVEEGQQVKKGDVLITLDLPYLEAHAKSTAVPVTFPDLPALRAIQTEKMGPITAGEKLVTIRSIKKRRPVDRK